MGAQVLKRRSVREGLDLDISGRLLAWVLVGGSLGAHLVDRLVYFPASRPTRFLAFDHPGKVTTFFLGVLYAPVRFLLFLRIVDVRYAGLTPGQCGAMALFIAGLVLLIRSTRVQPAPERARADLGQPRRSPGARCDRPGDPYGHRAVTPQVTTQGRRAVLRSAKPDAACQIVCDRGMHNEAAASLLPRGARTWHGDFRPPGGLEAQAGHLRSQG